MTSAAPITDDEQRAIDDNRAAQAAWSAAQSDRARSAIEEAKRQWLLARSPDDHWLGQEHVAACDDDTGTAQPMHRIVGALSASEFLAERLGAPSGTDYITDRAWIYLRKYHRSWMEPLIADEVADRPLERKGDVERELRELCDPEHAVDQGEPRLRDFAQHLYKHKGDLNPRDSFWAWCLRFPSARSLPAPLQPTACALVCRQGRTRLPREAWQRRPRFQCPRPRRGPIDRGRVAQRVRES